MPFLASSERLLEALFQNALLLKVDVAITVTSSSANGAVVGVMRRGIEENIAQVVSKWTGIPVSKLKQSETNKILSLNKNPNHNNPGPNKI